MPTYERADAATLKLLQKAMVMFHGPKAEAEVAVQVLMAIPTTDDNGDPVGHAVMVGGYRALACIRILGLKDRVARGFDAEMVIDAMHFEESTPDERLAIIDHELTHLELCIDDKGTVKRDDADRPKLRMAKHDRNFGWFDACARRHGDNSVEVKQAREMLEDIEFKQLYLFEVSTA